MELATYMVQGTIMIITMELISELHLALKSAQQKVVKYTLLKAT